MDYANTQGNLFSSVTRLMQIQAFYVLGHLEHDAQDSHFSVNNQTAEIQHNTKRMLSVHKPHQS